MSTLEDCPQQPPDFEAATSAPVRKTVIREYAETIVLCVLLLVFARSFVFIQSKIPTGSMENTILVGDYIMINRFLYGAQGDSSFLLPGQREIQRGDIIVFAYPADPDLDYVKRVVGLPGESVSIVGGRVFIDGAPLDEPYVEHENYDPRSFPARVVPEGEYFVLGDNRQHSEDSRYWGFVPRSLVRGRAMLIWYSYEEERGDYLKTGMQRIASIARKIPQLPFKTRWERILRRLR